MTNESYTDSLGIYKQIEDETDGNSCLLTAYMVPEYFQHAFLVYICISLYGKYYLHFMEKEYRLKRINYSPRSQSWYSTETEL